MTHSASRVPNFAGVALVDILANGVAVLIIVIVVSIAARAEKEQQYTEKVQEIAAVMTREFSVSLVLNKIAASPPAQLHDYEHSLIDQHWDPAVMPVIEFHRSLLRDPYSGKIWYRDELLKQPNSLDEFLNELSPTARNSIRGDIYDVGTYYLAMSIIQDHSLRIWHWHFMGGSGGGMASSGSPSDCPPGVSFEDCVRYGSAIADAVPDLPDLAGYSGENQTRGDSNSPAQPSWPPSDSDQGQLGANPGSTMAQEGAVVPDGSTLGSELNDPGNMGSFPNAQTPPGMQPGTPSNGTPPEGSVFGNPQLGDSTRNLSFRLADPNSQTMEAATIDDLEMPEEDELLAALMIYLYDIQELLDLGQPPTELIQNFLADVLDNVSRIGAYDLERLEPIEDLLDSLLLRTQSGETATAQLPIGIDMQFIEDQKYAQIKVIPNRLLYEAIAITDPSRENEAIDTAVPKLSLNKFPDVWQGLQVPLNRGSVLLMPTREQPTITPSWHVVAYLSSRLDDIIVGFVYGTVEADNGYVTVYADSNRVRLDQQEITPLPKVAFFGVKTWLVTFYITLAVLLLGLILFWRPEAKPS